MNPIHGATPGRPAVLRVYHSGVVRTWRARDRALRASGIDVTLVSPRRWNEGGADVELGDDHEPWVVPARTIGRHPYVFLYAPWTLWKVLRSQRFDVLDVHEEPASLAALEMRLLAWLTGHRRTPMLLYGAQNLEKRYPFPFNVIERGSLRRAAATYPCNDEAGAIFVRKGFNGIVRPLPLGIEFDMFRPAEFVAQRDDGSFRVGYVGRLEEHKGVQVAIDAMSHLPEEVVLDIVGDGSYRRVLEELVSSRGLAHRVRFHGHRAQHETNAYYRNFDLLVVPSQTRPTLMEQFGRVVVESMASGTPVVVSDSGSLPEIAGDAGIVVPEADAAAWADAIALLRSDPALGERLRAAALVRARSFDWTSVAERQAQLYRDVTA